MSYYDELGDAYEIPCPWCGKTVCIQDIATDGCLESGFVTTCDDCDREIEIVDVEYSATVYVKKHEAESASEGE